MSTVTSSSQVQTQRLRNAKKTSSTFTLLSRHNTRKKNKVLNTTPYDIHSSKQTLSRHLRTKLAQLRANQSPPLLSYLHTVYPDTYTLQCSLSLTHPHDTSHLFNCS